MDIKEILSKHLKWLNNEPGGERANMRGAKLYSADLRGADLRGANLCDADPYGADLRCADLRGANLCGADLYGADLRGADLCGADLCGANLRGANLCDAKNLDKMHWNGTTSFYPLQCPESGAYTAYKKASGKIVELLIPADAKRSSATSRKCRASKAVVVSISTLDGAVYDGTVCSDHDHSFIYEVGKTLEVENFDENRWNECAPGIHHFITRDEAVRYQ